MTEHTDQPAGRPLEVERHLIDELLAALLEVDQPDLMIDGLVTSAEAAAAAGHHQSARVTLALARLAAAVHVADQVVDVDVPDDPSALADG